MHTSFAAVLFDQGQSEVDPGRAGTFRGQLRIATGGHNCGRGVGPPELADQLPAFLGRDGGDGTGVEDAELRGLPRSDNPVPGRGKTPSHGLDLTDIETAADGFETDAHQALENCGRPIQPARRSLIFSRILAFSSSI